MNPGNGFVQIRYGLVEPGDKIYIPTIGSHVEVEQDSIFQGSSVAAHKAVWRASHKVNVSPSFANSTERCDHVSELDHCVLRQDGYYDLHRVVVGKDNEFVYLRPVAQAGASGRTSTTTNKVCRRTGKAWKWDETGWTGMPGTELRAEGEIGFRVSTQTADPVRSSAFYGD
jgi:hypothetical protein